MIRAACLAVGIVAPAAAEVPARVVSMNLCTDQLALMLAAPEQLVSVSALAQDPTASVMAEAAARLPANHGQAEEIFLMRPDLVLAGTFSSPATVTLLRRMGVRVETFAPESTLGDIRTNMLRMGQLLGREAAAKAAVARFDADVAALRDTSRNSRAAIYGANGYTAGRDSLGGQIVDLAGFDNIADELGIGIGGTVPLEVLVLSAPDLVIRGAAYPGASRAEAVLDHPALRDLAPQHVTNRDWVCGTPQILRAARELGEVE